MYGAFLRRVRASRGLSQAQLAEVAGISQPNLSAYENDRRMPTLDTFNRLLVACGYQVAADGGSTALHMPFPVGAGGYPFDDLPPRLPDDPPDEPPSVPLDATPGQRAQILLSVLEVASAIDAGKAAMARGSD